VEGSDLLRCTMADMSFDDDPRPTPWPAWVRIVALLLIAGLVGLYVLSLF
jgi:hypothetical protein